MDEKDPVSETPSEEVSHASGDSSDVVKSEVPEPEVPETEQGPSENVSSDKPKSDDIVDNSESGPKDSESELQNHVDHDMSVTDTENDCEKEEGKKNNEDETTSMETDTQDADNDGMCVFLHLWVVISCIPAKHCNIDAMGTSFDYNINRLLLALD